MERFCTMLPAKVELIRNIIPEKNCFGFLRKVLSSWWLSHVVLRQRNVKDFPLLVNRSLLFRQSSRSKLRGIHELAPIIIINRCGESFRCMPSPFQLNCIFSFVEKVFSLALSELSFLMTTIAIQPSCTQRFIPYLPESPP